MDLDGDDLKPRPSSLLSAERMRLAELQVRFATVASAPSAPAPALTLAVLSGIMPEETELLAARVGALVAALGAQEPAGGGGVSVGRGGARALGDHIRAARGGGWCAQIAEIDAEDASPLPAPPTREASAEGDKRPIRRRVFFER
ncbi:hypothetical protein FB451DRAFT_1396869 [Mycena latifolia]|nr:hypothetical protein FB451DRAFT_1396869 [Mycena latifolia]